MASAGHTRAENRRKSLSFSLSIEPASPVDVDSTDPPSSRTRSKASQLSATYSKIADEFPIVPAPGGGHRRSDSLDAVHDHQGLAQGEISSVGGVSGSAGASMAKRRPSRSTIVIPEHLVDPQTSSGPPAMQTTASEEKRSAFSQPRRHNTQSASATRPGFLSSLKDWNQTSSWRQYRLSWDLLVVGILVGLLVSMMTKTEPVSIIKYRPPPPVSADTAEMALEIRKRILDRPHILGGPYHDDPAHARRWSPRRAQAWYKAQPWIVGVTYITSTASNTLEMWQKETFDLPTITRELEHAHRVGFNTLRVFLHDIPFHTDRAGFLRRFETLLSIADRNQLRIIPVLFDSRWDPYPNPGPQLPIIKGAHNSRWVQCPGFPTVLNTTHGHARMKDYVTTLVRTHARDPRILMWDVWNEPEFHILFEDPSWHMMPEVKVDRRTQLAIGHLVPSVFRWARSMDPTQPLTSAPWTGPGRWSNTPSMTRVERAQLLLSDIVTFHSYRSWQDVKNVQANLRGLTNRPVLLTEFLARSIGSDVANIFRMARDEQMGLVTNGFIAGRAQLNLPWSCNRLQPYGIRKEKPRKRRPKVSVDESDGAKEEDDDGSSAAGGKKQKQQTKKKQKKKAKPANPLNEKEADSDEALAAIAEDADVEDEKAEEEDDDEGESEPVEWDYELDEPVIWHHDLFRADLSPYSREEIKVIRRVITAANTPPKNS